MEQKNHSLFLKSESTDCLSYIMIVDTIKNKYTINSKQCPDLKLFDFFEYRLWSPTGLCLNPSSYPYKLCDLEKNNLMPMCTWLAGL